ncbi:hypothetical protein OG596_20010 [Streptomyces sp. NBC_01102]|uniref:hypothetical protein n=1 Tax=unclassified Streptomyces TaxID=2593676 RepID=UPI0038681308|nr:hypothetical protein OG596_20010 [Streptomyces sp. NBC_01102]
MDGAALPLVPLAGALLPSAVRLLTLRLPNGRGPARTRVLVAVVCAAGVLVLSAWGLHSWAGPAPGPDLMVLPGTVGSDLHL